MTNSTADDQITVGSTTFSTNVTSGSSTKMDLATAASKWALRQTVNFYSSTSQNVNYTRSSSDPVNQASSSGADFNGISSAKKKKSLFSSIISIIASAAAIASVVATAGGSALIIAAYTNSAGLSTDGTTHNSSYKKNSYCNK